MASEAQINANRQNAARSTGPKTIEGKEASRANAYKHGLTGSGTVLPEREAAEVARRSAAFMEELQPSGEVGRALAHRAAMLSVRMERCVEHENAALTDRVRRAQDECEVPEGCDAAEAARLQAEAEKRALFDPSKEASLARKYEAAAERGFFRALKELRQVERAAKAAREQADAGLAAELIGGTLGSFLPGDLTHEEFDAMCREEAFSGPRESEGPVAKDLFRPSRGVVDVPLTIGRRC